MDVFGESISDIRLQSRMSYDDEIWIYWDSQSNVFYDACGFEMADALEVITPNDLLLFRTDPGYCQFPRRTNPRVLCIIFTDDQCP
jgi:hypothetical protein